MSNQAPMLRVMPARAAAAAPAPAPAPPVQTFGWDSVFAVRIADVNAQLRKPGASPATFDAALPGVATCRGGFGPWQVLVGEDGGDGTILRMQAPVTQGTLTFQGTDHDMAGGTVVFDVELAFLEHPDPPPPSGTRRALQVNAAAASAGQAVVHVADFRFGDDLVRALAIATLQGWFNANIGLFTHVFGLVDLNAVLAQQHLQWLAPRFTGYAYQNGSTEADSMLGILCMTAADTAAGATPQLSPAAIPLAQRAGLLISPDLMLRNLFLPSLLHAFPGAALGDFEVRPGPEIGNLHEIALAPVKHGGLTYHPVLQTMALRIDGDGMRLESLTRIPISPGIVAYARQTSFHQVTLRDRGDGTQTITLVEARPAETENWTDVATGIEIVKDILIIIAFVVELVLAALTGGAALVIGGIIVGLLFGLAAATPDLIAAIAGGEVSRESPAVDVLVDAATGTVTWQGSGAFRIGTVALSGAMVLGGDPQFLA